MVFYVLLYFQGSQTKLTDTIMIIIPTYAFVFQGYYQHMQAFYFWNLLL